MKLSNAIDIKINELLQEYREVQYESNEKIEMNRNVNKSEFLSEECNLDHTEVEIIDNRFNELDDTYINAVEVKFKIKRKGKRKFEDLKVYYRIIEK